MCVCGSGVGRVVGMALLGGWWWLASVWVVQRERLHHCSSCILLSSVLGFAVDARTLRRNVGWCGMRCFCVYFVGGKHVYVVYGIVYAENGQQVCSIGAYERQRVRERRRVRERF